jgi:hypothetical protein
MVIDEILDLESIRIKPYMSSMLLGSQACYTHVASSEDVWCIHMLLQVKMHGIHIHLHPST